MKYLLVAAAALAATGAALVIYLLFVETGGSGSARALVATPAATAPAPRPTPVPKLWRDALAAPGPDARLIACDDANGDGRLDAADGPALAGLDIALAPGSCAANYGRADVLETPPPAPLACGGGRAPLLIVAIASAGSTLRDTSEGESTGLIDILHAVQSRATGILSETIVASPAIFGADPPQTDMERWIEHETKRRLDALPCLRVVLIGHSHGGVTVTAVTSALDAMYGDRMFGVLIDRTTVLYDREATEMPARTPLLNMYQLNEGWHGVRIDLPNVINDDESGERAPVALSDGGGGQALVSHKTLDDSPGVQQRIEDAVLGWLARP